MCIPGYASKTIIQYLSRCDGDVPYPVVILSVYIGQIIGHHRTKFESETQRTLEFGSNINLQIRQFCGWLQQFSMHIRRTCVCVVRHYWDDDDAVAVGPDNLTIYMCSETLSYAWGD